MQLAVKTALLSVSDRTGLVDFARFLADTGVRLIATGGTCATLREAGLQVAEIGEYTGFPEIMDGRVKTLHPTVHGGILADRDKPAHRDAMDAHGIPPIDLVAINLYPFERVVEDHWGTDDAGYATVVENIDIGGPAMIRAAAKNHRHVAVLTSPDQYADVQAELGSDGTIAFATRQRLAFEAYRRTAAYDSIITSWFDRQAEHRMGQVTTDAPPPAPAYFVRRYDKRADLRYGENPHQVAAFYGEAGPHTASVATADLVRGASLSYNNILDCDAALGLAGEYAAPACAVIKHTNPSGAAIADDIVEAFRKAREADPVSAYGGIIGLNRTVDTALAEAILAKGQFFECVVAPGFTDEALAMVDAGKAWVKRLRLLQVASDDGTLHPDRDRPGFIVRGIEGGLLVQSTNAPLFAPQAESGLPWTVATDSAPDDAQLRDLEFAWAVCKHVKSNAIVLARDGVAIGVGAGQMSRVESVGLAVRRAAVSGGAAGAVLASDAFFPFADGVQAAIDAGVKAIIQPGGSKRDDEVIAACNAAKVPMLMTGMRHFRH